MVLDVVEVALLVMVVWELVVGRTGAVGEMVLVVSVEVGEEKEDDVVLVLVVVWVEDEVVDTEVGTVGTVETVEDEMKVVDCLVTVYVDTNAPNQLVKLR